MCTEKRRIGDFAEEQNGLKKINSRPLGTGAGCFISEQVKRDYRTANRTALLSELSELVEKRSIYRPAARS
jgi:hypothetical protein